MTIQDDPPAPEATEIKDGNTASNQGGQAPPPPPDPPKPTPTGTATAAPPGSQMNINTGKLDANRAVFTDRYQEFKTAYILNDGGGFPNLAIRTFAFKDNWRITKERQEELASLFVADPAEVERLRCLLIEKRVLILSGELGLGKAATAIYLSRLISARNGAENIRERVEAKDEEAKTTETYLIPFLDRHLKIDLNSDILGHHFAIFENAFAYRNPHLLEFFEQLNEFSLPGYTDHLKKIDSYVVFTVTTSEASQLRLNRADRDLQYELKQLSDELLSKGLEQRLTHLAQNPKISAERLKYLQEPERQQLLVARLRTMPSLVDFVDHYLRESGAAEVGDDLDEVLRSFEDITYWFHRDLPRDFEAWCSTLALGLAHCLGDEQGVPWVDFESLRRMVSQCLKRDPELFPPKFSFNGQPFSEVSEKAPTLLDDFYLDKSRAKIFKDPTGIIDFIRFNEESYPRKLWEVLLKHHRRVLMILLPRLRAIAEDYSGEHDPRQRALCAQIIGRIGEIDPDRITLSSMNRWIYSDDVRHRAAIGALYQGLLASKDERYRVYFLKLLKSLTDSDGAAEDKEEEKNRLLTSIAVYSRIGSYDLSLAMEGLQKIAREKLVEIMQGVHIERYIERAESKFAEKLSVEEAITLRDYQEFLNDVAERLYNQQASTFVGVQYALCSLALNTNPISVFRELRHWIEASSQVTGALVALMFLIQDGIAATLASRQVEIANNNEATSVEIRTCNPMIVALTDGQETVLEMARFLVTIFESFSATFIFPNAFIRHLRKSFLLHLENWVEEALQIESCRQAMENLFVELMRIHKGVLSEPIYQLLNNPEFSKKEPDLKKAFVNAVLWQRH